MFFPPCVTFCGIVDVVLSNQRYPVELTHGVVPFSNAIRVPFQMLDTSNGAADYMALVNELVVKDKNR